MKIPKIIHYCWFGGKPIPEKEKQCINSWKQYFPDFEIRFWNENTFDLLSAPSFAKQAYEQKKFAFVSDYVRVKVLYDFGGIYFDTDVEVLTSFEKLMDNNGFLGFENSKNVGTATMAFVSHHPILKSFLDYYESHPFIDKNGNADITANVSILTDVLSKYGFIGNGKQQEIDDVIVYPRDWFYPKKISETNFLTTENTLAVHKFSCSWLSEKQKKRGNNWFWINIARPILQNSKNIGILLLGKERIRELEILIRNKLK